MRRKEVEFPKIYGLTGPSVTEKHLPFVEFLQASAKKVKELETLLAASERNARTAGCQGDFLSGAQSAGALLMIRAIEARRLQSPLTGTHLGCLLSSSRHVDTRSGVKRPDPRP